MRKHLIAVLIASSSCAAASDIDVLRTNTETGFKRVDAFATQVNKRAIMNSKNITELQIKKVDKTVFEADQRRQDRALAVETQARIDGDKRNAAALGSLETSVNDVAGGVIHVSQSVQDVNQSVQDVNQAVQGVSQAVQGVSQRVGTESDTRASSDAALSGRIDGKVDTAEYNSRSALREERDSGQDARTSQNSARIDDTNLELGSLARSSNANFRALRNEVKSNKQRADAGIAGVAAMASIPALRQYQSFNVGAGVGNRGGQQAVAVGFSAALSDRATVKVSTAYDTKGSFTAAAGVAYGW